MASKTDSTSAQVRQKLAASTVMVRAASVRPCRKRFVCTGSYTHTILPARLPAKPGFKVGGSGGEATSYRPSLPIPMRWQTFRDLPLRWQTFRDLPLRWQTSHHPSPPSQPYGSTEKHIVGGHQSQLHEGIWRHPVRNHVDFAQMDC